MAVGPAGWVGAERYAVDEDFVLCAAPRGGARLGEARKGIALSADHPHREDLAVRGEPLPDQGRGEMHDDFEVTILSHEDDNQRKNLAFVLKFSTGEDGRILKHLSHNLILELSSFL